MKKEQVQITLSQLIEDLGNGMTWLEKDNEGYGSIQKKYGAKDVEIMTIQKHPKLKGIEPTIREFVIIDDLKDESKSNTTDQSRKSASAGSDSKSHGLVVDLEAPAATLEEVTADTSSAEEDDSFDKL